MDRVRAKRRGQQRAIADRLLKLGNEFIADVGGEATLLVCVTKVDAVWTSLKAGARLDALGEPGALRMGVVRYLRYLARRPSSDYHPDPTVASLLQLIANPRNRLAIATDLVEYYSEPENFWDLVERGRGAVLEFPSVGTAPGRNWPRAELPSIDRYLSAAARLAPTATVSGGRRTADLLSMRDLVMSALGCGVMHALGYVAEVESLMQRPWVRVEFFLCSPLAAAPASRTSGEAGFDPAEGGAFAKASDRSAGLTQILLRMLRAVL